MNNYIHESFTFTGAIYIYRSVVDLLVACPSGEEENVAVQLYIRMLGWE